MKLSDNGLKFIKRFEAYMKELPDGSCTAYQEVLGKKNGEPILDIPTIGWGCTAGVKMGMVWSREKAEDALKIEIAEHEAIVNRVVTTELTQGQFDALVSFNYNCGKLPSSTLLKYVNARKFDKALSEFDKFVFAGGVRLKGLERRRAGEKALFLEPDSNAREHTPQQAGTASVIQAVKENAGTIAKVAGAAVAGGGATVATQPEKPKLDAKAVIAKGKETREVIEQAKDLGLFARDFGKWASGDGMLITAGIAAAAIVAVLWSRK